VHTHGSNKTGKFALFNNTLTNVVCTIGIILCKCFTSGKHVFLYHYQIVQLEPQIYGMMAYVTLTDIDYPVLGSLVYLLAPKDFYIIWLSNLLTMR